MSKAEQKPSHYRHRSEARKNETLLSAVQALFGGSVVYRLFAHFLKDPEFERHVANLIPKERLPLIAAGTIAAGAIGLISQRSLSQSAEKQLGHALDEMTEEAKDLRLENERLRDERGDRTGPRHRITNACYQSTLDQKSPERSK